MQRQKHRQPKVDRNTHERGYKKILTLTAMAAAFGGFNLFQKIGKFASKGRIKFKDYHQPKAREIDRIARRESLDNWAAMQNYQGWAGHPYACQ